MKREGIRRESNLFAKAMLLTVCLMTLVMLLPFRVHAAGAVTRQAVKLEDGKTYSNYDIDGDGKVDKFKVKYTGYAGGKTPYISIYLNNRYLTQITQGAKGGYAYLMVPTQGKAYIAAQSYGFGFNSLWLYRYQNKRFVQAYQNSIGEEALDYAVPDKVWANGFSVNVSMGKHQTFLGIGRLRSNGSYLEPEATFRVNYKLVNGKAVLASRTANVVGTYHAGKAQNQLRLSSCASIISNSKGPLLRKGEKGILTKIYINDRKQGYDRVSYQIKTSSGKYGWVTPSMYKNINWNSSRYPFLPLY